jgi:RNA polymerase sigma-70 factor (ECF subfamily)
VLAKPVRPTRRRDATPAPPADEVAALVAAARRGDREAFDELVRRTHRDAFRLALRLTADAEDARDVVQDAYLRAYKGIRRFRGDAQFSTWLYRIVANCASTHAGRGARHRHDELDADVVVVDVRPESDPEAVAQLGAVRRDLDAAIAELPDRLRAVVVLRDVYDLPHEAIAAELGITESAAKVRLHRARLRLRERLFEPAAGGTAEAGRHAV